eukprot:COSAG02_NODE_588_length_19902_cov_115.928900_23_plen_35_part_00
MFCMVYAADLGTVVCGVWTAYRTAVALRVRSLYY